jgi:hypothetical protein
MFLMAGRRTDIAAIEITAIAKTAGISSVDEGASERPTEAS